MIFSAKIVFEVLGGKTGTILKRCVLLHRKNTRDMANDYPTEEPKPTMASEPVSGYGTVAKQTYRIISDEEITQCIPLEESRRRLTEKIYNFYHPEA